MSPSIRTAVTGPGGSSSASGGTGGSVPAGRGPGGPVRPAAPEPAAECPRQDANAPAAQRAAGLEGSSRPRGSQAPGSDSGDVRALGRPPGAAHRPRLPHPPARRTGRGGSGGHARSARAPPLSQPRAGFRPEHGAEVRRRLPASAARDEAGRRGGGPALKDGSRNLWAPPQRPGLPDAPFPGDAPGPHFPERREDGRGAGLWC